MKNRFFFLEMLGISENLGLKTEIGAQKPILTRYFENRKSGFFNAKKTGFLRKPVSLKSTIRPIPSSTAL